MQVFLIYLISVIDCSVFLGLELSVVSISVFVQKLRFISVNSLPPATKLNERLCFHFVSLVTTS